MLVITMKCYFIFIIIYILDRIIIKLNKNGRWFQLHAIINIIITLLTMNDVKDCITNPEKSNEIVPLQNSAGFALLLHIYHCLMFKIRYDDWIHHISSVFLTTPIFVSYPCKGTSFFLFIATGLPGAIDYIGLSLYKNDVISKYKQKHITSLINSYIRMPGGAICSFLLFKDGMYNNGIYNEPYHNLNIMKLMLSMVCFVNTSYYGVQAIQNFENYKNNLF